MGALVEVRDVCKIYNPGENEVRALDHVDVTIQENEFVAIIGHSGSGKSTLMNMLGCLDVPTSGTYFLHGQDVSGMSDDELRVGKRERKQLARQALEKVGLSHRMFHKPSEMSGGQQQRVAIARAIAQAPPIILADEPTGNLDSHSTREIMGILKKLHQDGHTVILITHDNDIAARAERVIRIRDGKIEEDVMRRGERNE